MTDPTCRDCGKTLVWSTPYVKGKPPVETDGSEHNCAAPAAAVGKPRVEVPIEQICAEITAVMGTMSQKGQDGMETPTEIIPMSPEMIEGIWKFAISRKMSR